MKKSIKKNYLYNLFYQILSLLTPLITTPYISRVLGADGIGTVSYVGSIVSYFSLFAVMGITTYGQREISYVQDDKEKRSEVFWNTKVLECFTAGVALFIYILFSLQQEERSIYLIYSFNIVAVLFDVNWFFQGMEEFGKIVARNTVLKMINIAYIFLMVKSKNDLSVYVFGLTFFTVVSNMSLWPYLKKYIVKPKSSTLRPFNNFRTVVSLFVPTIAIQVYTVLDKTMIGVITKDAFENGFYEQSMKLARMVLLVVTSLGTVVIPRIGYYYKNNNSNEIQHLMYRGYRFVWMLGIPLCIGLIEVSSNFVPWFYGPGYDSVIELLKISSFLILAIGINNVTGVQYMIPTNRQNLFTITVVIGAVVNVALNAALIPAHGALGATIASVIAETVIAIVQIIIVRKELYPFRIITESFHYIVSGVAMCLCLRILGNRMSPSVLNTIILVIVGTAVYGIVLIIEKDEFLLSNMRIVTNKIIKK